MELEQSDSLASADWCEVVAWQPGAGVMDPVMRSRIVESGLPWRVRDPVTGIELVLIMPGEFLMGSPDAEAGRGEDEGPQHRVLLTKAFYIGAAEVTQAQWRHLMGPTSFFFEGEERPIDPSWLDVQAYLARASEGLAPGVEALRLPTEAEWEYACRAGTTGAFSLSGPLGQDLVNFNDGAVESGAVVDGKLVVTWSKPPSPECRMSTVPAGSLPPNAWGLHEMHGNLWEWCEDDYAPDAFVGRDPVAIDPIFRSTGSGPRVLRGGSFYDQPRDCRSAARDAGGPDVRSNRIGFRVARTP